MKLLVTATMAIALSGCAMNMTLMPRDSGKSYSGELIGNGTGSGTMTMTMEGGDVCTGPAARVASNESFGFANTYASNNRGGSASAVSTISTTGDVAVKAILSCKSGKGLRCDITGRNGNGGGVCVDDSGKVYDALAIRK